MKVMIICGKKEGYNFKLSDTYHVFNSKKDANYFIENRKDLKILTILEVPVISILTKEDLKDD